MENNHPIHWVFFDFAGTLAFNDPPRVWHYLRALARRGIFVNRRDIWTAFNGAWATVDSPGGIEHPHASESRESYEAYRAGVEAQILDRLGIEKDRDQIVGEVLAIQDNPTAYTLYPEALQALEGLDQAGYHISIVSNFSWDLPLLVDSLGLSPYVASVITSAQIGYRKPHPRIFHAAMETMGANPSQSLFVGDTYDADILGPSELGFKTLLVDRRQNKRHDHPSIRFLTDILEYLNGSEQPDL